MKATHQILKDAKRLIRQRIQAAGGWTYYATPENCLFGPHGGTGSFGCTDIERAGGGNYHHGLAVIAMAKKIAARWAKMVAHLNQWRELRQEHFADNSTESVQINRSGAQRRVMMIAPAGDRCF